MEISPYLDALFAVKSLFRCLDDEAKQEFLDEVLEVHKIPLERLFREDYVDFSNAVEFSNEPSFCGDCFVYVWTDKDGNVFYVGRGAHTRVADKFARSEEFKETFKRGGCKVHVIAAYLSKQEAVRQELACIQHAQSRGCKLANRKQTLSDDEVKYFMARNSGLEVETVKSYEIDYDEYKCTGAPEVFEALDCIIFSRTKRDSA